MLHPRRARRVLHRAPQFARNLARSGIDPIEFWFSVSSEEQRRRFSERERHPLKQWKLSPIDLASLDTWDDGTAAEETMFTFTDTDDCPWTDIESDCKERARLHAMRFVLHELPYTGKDTDRIGPLEPVLAGRPADVLDPQGS